MIFQKIVKKRLENPFELEIRTNIATGSTGRGVSSAESSAAVAFAPPYLSAARDEMRASCGEDVRCRELCLVAGSADRQNFGKLLITRSNYRF